MPNGQAALGTGDDANVLGQFLVVVDEYVP